MPSSPPPRSRLLCDPRDRLPLLLLGAGAAVLALWPCGLTIALLLWWNANTVAHQATHRRFFRHRGCEAAFGAVLTLLLGAPQQLWRTRHLAHHAGCLTHGPRQRGRPDLELLLQALLLLLLWGALAVLAPAFLCSSYAPGLAAGLLLCLLHGRGEHCGGGTVSCHGRLWNLLFLNDGYHVEHHACPQAHFTDLPALRRPGARTSRLPPPLRCLRLPSLGVRVLDLLEWLERLVLRSRLLQALVLAVHRPALRRLLVAMPPPRRIVVVGGGLFPRTALLLRELLPAAAIVVLDADAGHLARAAAFLPAGVELRQGVFTPGDLLPCDLAVLPLALRGDRGRCYREPPAPFVIVHDWLWRRRGVCSAAAACLGKRLNLVRQPARTVAAATLAAAS